MKFFIQFIITIIILLTISGVAYLLVPEYPNYEFFSYSFFGGSSIYLIFYLILGLSRLVFKNRINTIIGILISFIFFEFLLFLIYDSSLIYSIVKQQKGEVILIYFLYNLVPLLSFLIFNFYVKFKSKRIE